MLSAGDTPSLTHYLFCTHVCSPPKIVFILSQISNFVNPENVPEWRNPDRMRAENSVFPCFPKCDRIKKRQNFSSAQPAKNR